MHVLGWLGNGNCHIMHRLESGGWPYSEVGRDSLKVPSLHAAVLHAAVFHSKVLRSDRNHWWSWVIGACRYHMLTTQDYLHAHTCLPIATHKLHFHMHGVQSSACKYMNYLKQRIAICKLPLDSCAHKELHICTFLNIEVLSAEKSLWLCQHKQLKLPLHMHCVSYHSWVLSIVPEHLIKSSALLECMRIPISYSALCPLAFMCLQVFLIVHHSFGSVYYCEHKPKNERGL